MEVTKAMNWKEKLQQAIKSIGELSSKIEDSAIQDSLKNIQKLLTDVLADVPSESGSLDENKSVAELKSLINELEKKFTASDEVSKSSATKVDDLEKKINDIDSAVVGLTEIIKEFMNSDGRDQNTEEADVEKAKKLLEDAGMNPNLIGASS
jgi:ABC-type transporter Mla subunit MlaD